MTTQNFNEQMNNNEWDEAEVQMAQHLLETSENTGSALRQMEEVMLLTPSEAYALWLHTSHLTRKQNTL